MDDLDLSEIPMPDQGNSKSNPSTGNNDAGGAGKDGESWRSEIGVPPTSSSASGDSGAGTARGREGGNPWEKAQAALSQMSPSQPESIQQTMLKLYPWMSGVGGSFAGGGGGGGGGNAMSGGSGGGGKWGGVSGWFPNSSASSSNLSDGGGGRGYGNYGGGDGSSGSALNSQQMGGGGFGGGNSQQQQQQPPYNSMFYNYGGNSQNSNNNINQSSMNAAGGGYYSQHQNKARLPPPGLVRPQLGPSNNSNSNNSNSNNNYPPHPTQYSSGNMNGFMGMNGAGGRGGGIRFGIGQRGGGRGGRGTGGNTQPLSYNRFNNNASNNSVPQATTSSKNITPSQPDTATMPSGMNEYIERAYMAANNEEEKNKVEKALKTKLMPLLQSGMAWKVDWTAELLPTDPAYETNQTRFNPNSWTPAAQLRNRGGGGGGAGNRGGGNRGGGVGNRNRGGRGGGTGGRQLWTPASDPDFNRDQRRRPPQRRRSRSRSRSRSADGWRGGGGGRNRSRSPRSRSSSRSPRSRSRSRSPRSSNSSGDDVIPLHHRQAKKEASKIDKRVKNQRQKKGWKMRENDALKQRRAERFNRGPNKPKAVISSRINFDAERIDIDDILTLDYNPTQIFSAGKTIVGTCQEVEKTFFRLTTAADPTDVRPEHVLKVSLRNVKERWKTDHRYDFANSQLRSIRQDLIVQRIRNEFTIEAYETHARIALEQKDREEFNQCQTQLKALYSEFPQSPNHFEFTAYRLLYYVSMENWLDITRLLSELTGEAKQNVCIKFALNVRKCWALSDYKGILAAYPKAPKMSSYVMDLFLERERKNALRKIIKSYRPSIPVPHVVSTLGFADSIADGIKFLGELGLLTDKDPSKIDCKQVINF